MTVSLIKCFYNNYLRVCNNINLSRRKCYFNERGLLALITYLLYIYIFVHEVFINFGGNFLGVVGKEKHQITLMYDAYLYEISKKLHQLIYIHFREFEMG